MRDQDDTIRYVTQFAAPEVPSSVVAPEVLGDRTRRAWVPRSRALARLCNRVLPPTVWISAPAGYGKSTLAKQWLERDDRLHATVHVAPYDDDPARLAGALVHALADLGVPVEVLARLLTATEPFFSSILVPGLQQLAGAADRPYLLVVDDVHQVHDGRCHRLLEAVAQGVPEGSTLALLSRAEPAAWLARARAERRLFELGARDLAFDQDEATALYRGLGLRPTRADVAHVVARSEGWAVGLYLTALAMQRDETTSLDWASAAPHGSDRFILDYLRSEVLAAASPDEREFMRCTSVLEDLESRLCDAVTGRTDSAAVLPALHNHIQLVLAMDNCGRRFRYHHLLREALAADLTATRPDLIPQLHSRAARWLADHGDIDAAVVHAKAAGDLALAGRLIWSNIGQCATTGRPDRLRGWLAGLTDTQIAQDGWLSLAAVVHARQGGDADVAARWMLAAQAHAGGPGWRERVRVDNYAATYAGLLATHGTCGLAETVSLCEDALIGLAADALPRPLVVFMRGVCLSVQRRHDLGSAALQEAVALARALGAPLLEADALSWQGMLAVLAGDLTRAEELTGRAHDLTRRHHLDQLVTSGQCVTAQALVLALRHDVGSATVALHSARRLIVLLPMPPWFAVCARLIQARTAILLGDGGLARTLIGEAGDLMTPDLADSLASDLLQDTTQALREMSREAMVGTALTAAELRVLQFLPSHLKTNQIGEHLHLSAYTVKSHTASIYRKLQVSSRDAAVERAQALGLVEAPARL